MSKQQPRNTSTASQPAPDSPDRKQTPQGQRQSEEKYRKLFEMINTGFSLCEAIRDEAGIMFDYRLIELNPAFLKLTGLHAQDVIGKTILEVMPGLDPWWIDTYRQVVGSRETIRVEKHLPELGRWYDLTAFYYGNDQFAVYYDDITERKRQEANLAFLVEVSRDLVKLTTMDETITALGAKIGGHFRVAGCAFCELNERMDEAVVTYEWHQADERSLVGRYRLADFYTDELRQILLAGVALVVSDSQTDSRVHAQRLAALNIGSYLVIPLIRDGQLRFVLCLYEAQARSWRDDEINLMSELASRIWAQLERTRAEAALRDVDRRKDEFLAMLAHELRNPMSTLQSGLQILTKIDGKDRASRDTLAMMNRQTDHLVRLVDDLLDVSRINQGKIALKKQRLDLVALVAQAAESVQALYQQQGRSLGVELPTAPIEVEGDPARLTQVVTNLLTNGARYTEDGGRVWLSLVQQSGPTGRQEALLQVRDNGIGLAADQLTAIFELFIQVDNSLARSKGGLGLGLTLVKRLVELHSGWVDAQSEGVGTGSTFRVHLPTLHAAPKPNSASAEDPSAGSTVRQILVVDDNADAALTLSMLLRLEGYQVQTRHSGQAGLEAVEALKPEVVLLDIGMPGLDGYETARAIRTQPWGRAVTLIALTGYGGEADKQRTQAAGFNGHLVKPVDLATLLALLTDLLPSV